ncbi:hypothetical protein [Leptobacterium sp. I13]|uniref:hypothetical protein n=1 Tax=Leptobacterium meishanense TaxID=3128904 RepID=UPI0030ED2577
MDKENKNRDAFIKKMIKEGGIVQAPESLIKNVMHRVEQETEQVKMAPLIVSKRFQLIITIIFIGVVLFLAYTGQEKSIFSTILTDVELPAIIEGLTISKTTTYSIAIATIMILMQVIVLRRRFYKEMDL